MVNADLIATAEDTGASCQLTVFESQLCRVLKKAELADRQKGCAKYISIFGVVKPSTVQQLLYCEAQRLIQ
jgi:hypothetical protein